MSYAFGGPIFDAGRLLQWTGGYAGIVPYWPGPLICVEIYNNPPEIPIIPLGTAIGVSAASYGYSTSDEIHDRVTYSFDWGDGATSTTDMVDSGSVESAPHTWVKAGRYRIKANATDSKGASSGWTDLMDVTINDNDPPNSPIVPSGPTSGRRKATYSIGIEINAD